MPNSVTFRTILFRVLKSVLVVPTFTFHEGFGKGNRRLNIRFIIDREGIKRRCMRWKSTIRWPALSQLFGSASSLLNSIFNSSTTLLFVREYFRSFISCETLKCLIVLVVELQIRRNTGKCPLLLFKILLLRKIVCSNICQNSFSAIQTKASSF